MLEQAAAAMGDAVALPLDVTDAAAPAAIAAAGGDARPKTRACVASLHRAVSHRCIVLCRIAARPRV
jgi:hypothetical protein